jgi:hypothetical protein
MVNIVDASVIFADYNTVQGSPLYNPAADLDGNGMVDIIDVGMVVGAYNAPVFS